MFQLIPMSHASSPTPMLSDDPLAYKTNLALPQKKLVLPQASAK
jgi:hypothetical protein